MSDYYNFCFKKAGNKYFCHFSPVINKNHQFFHAFYVVCLIRLLALLSTYWAETWVWLGASNWGYVKWNRWFLWSVVRIENVIWRIYWEIAHSVKFWRLHLHTGGMTLTCTWKPWPTSPGQGLKTLDGSILLTFLLETELHSKSFDTLDDLLGFQVQKLWSKAAVGNLYG